MFPPFKGDKVMLQNGKSKVELEAERLKKEREQKRQKRIEERIAQYRIDYHTLPVSLTIREAADVYRTTELTLRKRFKAYGFQFEKASVNGYIIPKERFFRFMAVASESNDWSDARQRAKAERERF